MGCLITWCTFSEHLSLREYPSSFPRAERRLRRAKLEYEMLPSLMVTEITGFSLGNLSTCTVLYAGNHGRIENGRPPRASLIFRWLCPSLLRRLDMAFCPVQNQKLRRCVLSVNTRRLWPMTMGSVVVSTSTAGPVPVNQNRMRHSFCFPGESMQAKTRSHGVPRRTTFWCFGVCPSAHVRLWVVSVGRLGCGVFIAIILLKHSGETLASRSVIKFHEGY